MYYQPYLNSNRRAWVFKPSQPICNTLPNPWELYCLDVKLSKLYSPFCYAFGSDGEDKYPPERYMVGLSIASHSLKVSVESPSWRDNIKLSISVVGQKRFARPAERDCYRIDIAASVDCYCINSANIDLSSESVLDVSFIFFQLVSNEGATDFCALFAWAASFHHLYLHIALVSLFVTPCWTAHIWDQILAHIFGRTYNGQEKVKASTQWTDATAGLLSRTSCLKPNSQRRKNSSWYSIYLWLENASSTSASILAKWKWTVAAVRIHSGSWRLTEDDYVSKSDLCISPVNYHQYHSDWSLECVKDVLKLTRHVHKASILIARYSWVLSRSEFQMSIWR